MAIFAENSVITLNQDEISFNHDGVLYLESSGRISSSLINDNYEVGIRTHTSSVKIINNVIQLQLWGIHSYESTDTITGNLIRNNISRAMIITRCNPLVFRNLIYDNICGIDCSGNPRIANNTIINNLTHAISCDWFAEPIFMNNIFYGNGDLINYDANDTVVFANCLLQVDILPIGLTDAGGNIFNEDPSFIDPVNEDFSLNEDSPCINTGLSFFEWDGEVFLDLDASEYQGYAPDIGAIESTVVDINDYTSRRSWENHIIAYPNPSRGETISITCQREGAGQRQLVVINSMGSLVFQQKIYGAENVICISNLPPGIYMAVVYEERMVIGKTKIVLQ